MKIRNSPSGPIVSNSGGAPYDPGSGAQLRLVDGTGTYGGSVVIPTVPAVIGSVVAGVPLTAQFQLPNVANKYGAHIKCDVANPSTNVPMTVQLYIDASLDGGTTWTEVGQNSHTCQPVVATGGARTVSLDIPLALGTDFGVTSSPVTPTLTFRARIGATTGGGVLLLESPTGAGSSQQRGSVYLACTENF